MNQINQTKPLEQILSKCEFKKPPINENNVCFKGFNPNNCKYLMSFLNKNYCKFPLIYDKAKQKDFAVWMER